MRWKFTTHNLIHMFIFFLCLRGLFHIIFQSIFHWTHISQYRMQTFSVIKQLNISEQISSYFFHCTIASSIDSFFFQCCKTKKSKQTALSKMSLIILELYKNKYRRETDFSTISSPSDLFFSIHPFTSFQRRNQCRKPIFFQKLVHLT